MERQGKIKKSSLKMEPAPPKLHQEPERKTDDCKNSYNLGG